LTGGGGWWDVQTRRHHILILGGTKEARLLAEALAQEPGLSVTCALHAPTGTVAAPKNCAMHVGSFGGEAGLVRYMAEQGVSVLVNALHPHAQTMQDRADRLFETLDMPTFRLARGLWQAQPGDRWTHFSDAETLTKAVQHAGHERLFCAVGPKAMAQFLPLSAFATVFARRFDVSRGPEDGSISWIDALPHPSIEAEIALLVQRGIHALVTKNSGGDRPTKLDAAAGLDLPVYMLDPPRRTSPAFERWEDIKDAIGALG